MTVTDPASLLADMDIGLWKKYKNVSDTILKPVKYVEPHVGLDDTPSVKAPQISSDPKEEFVPLQKINSKVVVLGDFIDTDQVSRPQSVSAITHRV